MELSEIKELLEENECIVFPDLEDALVGITCGWGELRAVYEWGKCIEVFMVRDGMSHEEACEHFSTNTAGTYAGEKTPEVVNTGYEPNPAPDGCLQVSKHCLLPNE
jgi:hypothetical protein